MNDMDVIMVSEESREKIHEIRTSPITLQSGRYKMTVCAGKTRYFIYTPKERLVEKLSFVTRVTEKAKILMDNGRDNEFAYAYDTEEIYRFSKLTNEWKKIADNIKCNRVQLSTQVKDQPALTERYLEEVEVDRETWING